MTADLEFDELLELLDADRGLLELLLDEGLITPPLERAYSVEEAEVARVARVLVRDLGVNVPGVEVILHMRRQIVLLQRRVVDVEERLEEARRR